MALFFELMRKLRCVEGRSGCNRALFKRTKGQVWSVAIAIGSIWNTSIANASDWPPITREQRPWAYWWWMGSAVDQTNLTRELTRYQEAGYGGVHIIPIYGAKGWESNYISYLSPKWMEMLDYTVREADRLNLGIDMTTGTGWCFGGGPYVGEKEGNATVVVKTVDLVAGASLKDKFDPNKTQALVAYPKGSAPIELTAKLDAEGKVDWTAPAGGAKVYAVSQKLSPQKVKRAAPGGEGPMLNLIYPDAMPVFLRSFTEAFDKYRGAKPRAQYHDSYEYKSEWAPDFFAQFERRRGYRLQGELPALFSKSDERSARALTDYRETVSDIMIEDSLPQWVKWSQRRGFITRNEAHGSPGNLLDLYALADVPETEMFRLDRNKLISKFASSAAHVAGRKFVGCETGTWLKEHFTETLADMKYLLDDLFVSGVNHVFYHGTCYSPDEAGWPGWVFYASYEMNPRNAVWHDVRALNDYVARCQALLQAGRSDNDVLLYWPIHDYWQKAGAEPLLPHLTVHARGWFEAQPIGQVAEEMWQRGYAFDYVSDRQLDAARVSRNQVKLPGGNYRVVVVPPCDFIALPTMERLLQLARSGATVVFVDELPKDVAGLAAVASRRAKLAELKQSLQSSGVTAIGKGKIIVGKLEAALQTANLQRESLVDHPGLFYLRRMQEEGRSYFVANRSEKAIDGWVSFATAAKAVRLLDPMNGRIGRGAMRSAANGTQVYLQLPAGASIFVQILDRDGKDADWVYSKSAAASELLVGKWQIDFISGGPVLPLAIKSQRLASWTELGGEAAQRFSGTARYAVKFDAVGLEGREVWLNLGQVSQSARVTVNGTDYGPVLTPPYRVKVDGLKRLGNELVVEVTSTSANRIRDLDRRGVKWQNFHDINFVNQDYRPFNAANWPLTPSGLLGPVTLTATTRFNPAEAEQ